VIERSRRFILLGAAGFLVALPIIKGHCPSTNDGHVAFLPFTSTHVIVRLGGDGVSRGIYALRAGSDVATVTNMTVPKLHHQMPGKALLETRLHQGDVVELSVVHPQQVEIKIQSMKARERILLGIPLDPDRMDYDDWRCLPGIGPVLARRILDNRQINGDFGSLEAVKRVEGIGTFRYGVLRKYF
jgi:competence protein ComEA